MLNCKSPHRTNLSSYISICFVLAVILSPISSAQEERPGIDWIFILDTSGSMNKRVRNSEPIFDSVQGSLKNFIAKANAGDTITLYTFDSSVKPLLDKQHITSNLDKENLQRIIDLIKANGSLTHTGEAIRDALIKKDEIRTTSSDPNRVVSIVIFTDGKEEVSDENTPRLSDIDASLIKSGSPYIYLVWLKDDPVGNELQRVLDAAGNMGKVITTTNEGEIGDLVNKIRPKALPLPEPVLIALNVKDPQLDFGELEPGDMSRREEVKLTSNISTPARVTLADPDEAGVALVEPQAPIQLNAGDNKFDVRLKVKSDAPNRESSIKLLVSPEPTGQNMMAVPVELSARLSVYRTPLWRTLLKWIGIFLLFAVGAVMAYSLYKGQMPHEMYRNFVRRNHLEGELEVLRPPSVAGSAIALWPIQSKRARLGSLLPEEVMGDSDAELVTVNKNGLKLIQLRCTRGSVRVNDLEMVSQEIYDGDIIEIGDARLQFNSLNERPSLNEDEAL